MEHNDGPRSLKTTKIYRLGASDAVALPKGGHPYTISVDKRGAGYSAAIYTSTNPVASPYAGGDWDLVDEDDTVDVVDLALSAGARAVLVRVSAITEALPSKHPLRMVIGTAKEQGWNQKQRANYGYQGHNALTVVGEYIQAVLADFEGETLGDFFPFQDGNLGTAATNIGPSGEVFTSATSAILEFDGPWGLTKSQGKASARMGFVDSAPSRTLPNEPWSFDGWFLQNATPVGEGDHTLIGAGAAVNACTLSGLKIDDSVKLTVKGNTGDFTNFPVWAASTAYAKGDRAAHSTFTFGIWEAEVGGTSGTIQPTNPAEGSTVVDNTITWRNVVNNRRDFNNGSVNTGFTIGNGEWFYAAMVRRAEDGGDIHVYINGTHRATLASPAFETTPGTFGSPRPRELVFGYFGGLHVGDLNTHAFNGKVAFCGAYPFALSDAQIAERYQRGVDLGFIDLE